MGPGPRDPKSNFETILTVLMCITRTVKGTLVCAISRWLPTSKASIFGLVGVASNVSLMICPMTIVRFGSLALIMAGVASHER